MRRALPLIYCVSDDTQAKLLGRITDMDSVPKLEWVDWLPIVFKVTPLPLRDLEAAREYYEREMRQKPSRSRD